MNKQQAINMCAQVKPQAETQPESIILAELDDLDVRISNLGVALDILTSRLKPVLKPSPPKNQTEPKFNDSNSRVVNVIKELGYHVTAYEERISDLINQIET